MVSNKYERDFTQQAHLKRAGRVDLRLFQYTSVLGDGYGGLQYMIHKMLGGVFNKFVIEGCQYTGGAVQQGYILYEGKVVEIEGETIAVANGEWLYLDSTGDASVTTTESTAMANCLIYMKEADATPHDIRFRKLDNVINAYHLTVNQNIDLYGDHINLHDGNLDDIASIDGGGDAVRMDDNLDINSKDLNNIGSNNVNINSLIQNEIDQIANINALVIDNTEWGYLAVLDQSLRQADSPTFDNVTISTDINITGEIVFPTATIHSSGAHIHIHPNTGNEDGNLTLHPIGSNTASAIYVRNNVSGNFGDFIFKVNGAVASLESAQGGSGSKPTTLNINQADWDNINIGDASATITINAVGISAVQFGYVGQMDQDVSQDQSPQFAGITITGTTNLDGQDINSVANIYLEDDIIHAGDPNNLISFGTDTQTFQTGGTTRIQLTNSGFRVGAAGQDINLTENSITNNADRLTTSAAVFAHSDAKTNPHEISLEQARTQSNTLSGDIDYNGNSIQNITRILIDRSPADTEGSGIISDVTLGGTVTIGDALYINSSGRYTPTDSDSTGSMPCSAIALEAGSNGNTRQVLLWGYYRDDSLFSSFNLGDRIYISETVGLFRNSPPSGAGDVVQCVGKLIDDGSGNKVLHFIPDITEIEIF